MTWRENCRRYIAALDEQMPEGITLDERKKRLRQAAFNFQGGTSWGKQVWSKERRAYLARFGEVIPDKPSPDGKLFQRTQSGDIIFPFRGEPTDVLRG